MDAQKIHDELKAISDRLKEIEKELMVQAYSETAEHIVDTTWRGRCAAKVESAKDAVDSAWITIGVTYLPRDANPVKDEVL